MEKIVIEGREAITAEYLTGGITYRKLGAKYGIDFRRIHSWVMKYQGKSIKKEKPKKRVSIKSWGVSYSGFALKIK